MRTTTSRRAGRSAGAIVASALGLTALAVSPAHAGDAVFNTGGDSGATATIDDVVFTGSALHIEGTNWTKTAGTGSCIMVKIGDGEGAALSGSSTMQKTPPAAAGVCTGVAALDGVYATIPAASDGSFSADLPFPTPENTSPAIASTAWAAGTKHHLRLLTGGDGGTPRSAFTNFTLYAPASTPTITPTASINASTGAATASLTGSGFAGGTVLSAKLGDTPVTFTVSNAQAPTYTVPAAGTFSRITVTLPAGTRAGSYTLTVAGDDGTTLALPITLAPTLSYDKGLKPGVSGTVSIAGLPTGAVVSELKIDTAVVASNLTAANADGKTSGAYAVPAATVPGAYAATLTQSSPAATYTLPNTVVYPDETLAGTNRFDVAVDPSNANGKAALFQGLYQSDYSERSKALFVSAALNSNGSGALYKLDPSTLAVLASATPTPASTSALPETGGVGAHGLGVDDVNGTVWTTNSRPYATVAVWSQTPDADGKLPLLKQFPMNTIEHPRDVAYDPVSNYVFVSSSGESAPTTGDPKKVNGYISVFEGGDNNGNGTKYEFVKDIQTGSRADFLPTSLDVDGGKVVTTSLLSNKVAVIDGRAGATSASVAPGQVDSAVRLVEVGEHITAGNGRGGTGVAYSLADNRIFVASQNDNSVWVANATTGALIKKAPTGQGALNVAYDAVHKLAYVTNFGGTTVTVLDKDGNKLAQLPIARANHVEIGAGGIAYVVDKNAGTSAAPAVNHVWKITPRLETVGGAEVIDPTAAGATGSPATTPLSIDVVYGQPIHLTGTNLRVKDGTTGGTIAVKLDSGAAEPKAGKATNPSNGDAAVNGVYGVAAADANGTWSIDLPFPTAESVNNPELAWGTDDTHHLRLLTGNLKSGDAPRSIAIKVHVVPASSTAGTVAIVGTAKVGQTLTATPSAWAAGTALSYIWKRDGAPIATGTTYTAIAADAGHQLTVTANGTLANHQDVSATSAAVTVAAADVPATPLTPAEKKVQAAQAKVAKAQAKVATVKVKIAQVKKSTLSKKAKAKQVAKLKKQLATAKKAVTKQKKALAKVKKAVKKAAKKK